MPSSPSTASSAGPETDRNRPKKRSRVESSVRKAAAKRRAIVESLEPRQLLAGPQLIGIQPNEGERIDDGAVRTIAPRSLTLRFDETQRIDPATLAGVQVVRSGPDGLFGPGAGGVSDDIVITPGLVTLGNPNENEVIVRFSENLPDDQYRVNVFGFDDNAAGITGLRNVDGEFFQPATPGANQQATNFRLDLGALIESIVPQPVVRNADGSLTQNRNEIVVYFNEDPLFVQDQSDGTPTPGSAENPQFYQLLLTKETARTTDDALYLPERVVYDEATHSARLFFGTDINQLTADHAVLTPQEIQQRTALTANVATAQAIVNQQSVQSPQPPTLPQARLNLRAAQDALATFEAQYAVGLGGGTFRLRIGTRVETRADLIVQPTNFPVASDPGGTLQTSVSVGTFNEADRLSSFVISETIAPASPATLGQITDIDLYRFQVDLNDEDRLGRFTAETFAERLTSTSDLDTAISLWQETRATATTDFRLGPSLQVRFTAVADAAAGNRAQINFIQTDRTAGNTAVRVLRLSDVDGRPINNGILIDVPRNTGPVPVSALISAINSDPFASSLMTAELVTGSPTTNIGGQTTPFNPITLTGGGLTQLSRNDDYFSEDSFLSTLLGTGTYYIGVSSSGNDEYDPELPDSGANGNSSGRYELLLKFEPQVDEINVLRDRDGDREGVPGTPIDGDGDGTPGGVQNFWFQTRNESRVVEFQLGGDAITPNQTISVTGGTGIVRVYEFVPTGGTKLRPDSIAVSYSSTPGFSSGPTNLADELATQINLREAETGVTVTSSLGRLTFTGERTLAFSTNFRGAQTYGRNIFVDKLGRAQADGSLAFPINNIASTVVVSAFAVALPGDIVRIVGNGGVDGLIETEADNFAYQIGLGETGGRVLDDGRNMEVPRGVTTMIDAGAALKFRNSYVTAGSSSLQVDRSGSVLQVLGTPRLLSLVAAYDPAANPAQTDAQLAPTLIAELNGSVPTVDDGSVIFTSTRDRSVAAAAATGAPQPSAGDWGGIIYRNDFDRAQGRRTLESQAIFLDRVNHSDIRYGGSSNVLIESTPQLVNPITVVDRRPTISFNEIFGSADAAISASPDSFEETTFQGPVFQAAGSFLADYDRVGPDINNNLLANNSVNALFVRIITTPNAPPLPLTVSGRFDDIDIVHHLADNLIVTGTPGGSVASTIRPDLTSVGAVPLIGGRLAAGTYQYRMTFVDAFGFESTPSDPSGSFVVATADSSLELRNLPPISQAENFVSRRLYRNVPGTANFVLIADLNANSQTFVDDGSRTTANSTLLVPNLTGTRGRLDASLNIDPGIILKLNTARIELGEGTQLLAEGTPQRPIILTSLRDDRFGVGGTFDTNNDRAVSTTLVVPARGDWSGIYASVGANVSFDSVTLAFAGGISFLPGGETKGFAPLELRGATGRIVSSNFEFNDDGRDGQGPDDRYGRGVVTASTIYVLNSQPTIVGNTFIDNRGNMIDIDVNSMDAVRRTDRGRQTGPVSRFADLDDNFGPLVRLNRYDNVRNDTVVERQLSALVIRGGTLLTDSVWDDTDIVHVLQSSVTVNSNTPGGGLRLISRAEESLVVKFFGAGNVHSPTVGTGLTATGLAAANQRTASIGGTVQVLGMPGSPVILTSFLDDSVGAGLTPAGRAFTDTNGDGAGSRPGPNDWRSVLFDTYANFTNVETVLERELASEVSPGLNGDAASAQFLGSLSPNAIFSDEQNRAGFEVEGFLEQVNDVDTYSFSAQAGTQVWIDLDRTSFTLDSVLEVLDPDGVVIARSDNSAAEVAGTQSLTNVNPSVAGLVGPLQASNQFGAFVDADSVNPRNAGLRLTLPGPVGSSSNYFVRVRSQSINPDDAAGGLTRGGYRFQIRLQEAQVSPGSIVKFADIRYANHGIHVRGAMTNSPLVGDAQENEQNANFGTTSNNNVAVSSLNTPGQRAQYLGNLAQARNVTYSVGGALSSNADIDHYQFDVSAAGVARQSVVFDIDYADGLAGRPNTSLALFYDPDGENGPLQPRLVAIGNDSNILEDQSSGANASSLELLSRGSVSTGDAYIGPLSLPAGTGTYYVAVAGQGTVPEVLTDPLVRLEPIDSVLRIFDDQLGSFLQTTALPPVNPQFVDTALLPLGWSLTTDRARDVGHNSRQTFNGSRNVNLYPDSIVNESESNNSFVTADVIDSALGWSLNDDPNVGDAFGNTSRLIPHTKVLGQTVNEIVDVFRFTVPQDGSRVILDVDNGFNPYTYPDDAGFGGIDVGNVDIEDFRSDSVDLKLQLFSDAGVLLQTSTFSPASSGALGSVANPLSLFSNDPYIDTILAAGTYFIAVSPEDTTFNATLGQFELPVAERPASGTYELNVSVENVLVNGGDPNNNSLLFDRSEFRGELESVPFDLRGYSAADRPVLYFDYLLSDIGQDDVRVIVQSNETPATILAGNALGIAGTTASLLQQNTANSFFQARLDLSAFAGDSNITVRFEYLTDLNVGAGQVAGGEGLYLDNFIVGFSERGELVVGAPSGSIGFSGASTSISGAYQLEMRAAQEYFAPGLGGLPNATFNTNARLAETTATIVAPYPDQITAGDQFTLSDNVRRVTFEFTTGGLPTPGTIGIDVGPAQAALVAAQAQLAAAVTPPEQAAARLAIAQTQVAVADAIRAAINLPAVQTLIHLPATDTAGSAIGGNGDPLIALAGFVVGDLTAVASAAVVQPGQPLPGGATFSLPTLFANQFGDGNLVREQDLVMIDSNRISDVNAIGIWYEPGERGVDPQDIKLLSANAAALGDFFGFNNGFAGVANRFLQQPPIGNTIPGAVRNLPTPNNSVVGGLVPGPVIVNNTIDNAGFAGIKVDGEIRPWQIDSSLVGDFLGDVGFGDAISDGLTMTIDAAGTRVTFEFEDIGGGATTGGGSGQVGGNGVVDGHVPIHFRHSGPNYNPPNIPAAARRGYASTRHEVMIAIFEAIQGSILITNGLVELVHATVGPSVQFGSDVSENRYLSEVSFPTAAVFLEGVSGIYFDTSFARGGAGNPLTATQSAVGEAAQPYSRIVNNTIYGADGTSGNFSQAGLTGAVDTDDLIVGARDTKIGVSHSGLYTTTGTIGNPNPLISANLDVDLYRVELKVGDRLLVDIDTAPDVNLDSFLQLLDASGIVVTSNDDGSAPDHLETAALPADFDSALARPTDSYLDFTATVEGTYYVAVSSAGNVGYDVRTLSGRTAGTGGTGIYDLSIRSLAPRNFVVSIDDLNLARNVNNTGTVGADLFGESITITQIPDRADGFVAPGTSNSIRFVFSNAQGGLRQNIAGETVVNVPIRADFRTEDIIAALADAINGAGFAVSQTFTNPPLPNHAFANGPGGITGPVGPVEAIALGGTDSHGLGSDTFRVAIPYPFGIGSDYQYGYGHDRTSEVDSDGVAGSTTSGRGTTERYLLISNAANVTVSEGSVLRLDPEAGSNIDQVLPETGIMLAGGSSATVLNNVLSNLNESVVVETSRLLGYGGNPNIIDLHPKQPIVVVSSNAFQHDETDTAVLRQNINALRNSGVGLSTDTMNGPSNVNGGTDDRNVTLANTAVLFVNAGGDNFLPTVQSAIIDSGTSSVTEQTALIDVKASVGLPASNILAPTRDGNFVKRADNDGAAPPNSGVGGDLFTDRGANELADFNGPIAIITTPLDNDGEGNDRDDTDSFLQLTTGNLGRFTIQLRDTGDLSDPFAGLGVDDNTVLVSAIDGVRPTGANFTLFEDDRLLTEGIDYTFSYDSTSNQVQLTPLSGVWRNDRSYRIALNNRDRSVLVAPAAGEIADGDQLQVTDSNGGTVVFEFETGYQLFLPETLTLILPDGDTSSAGLRDGDVFQITDPLGRLVTFEFDRDGATLADRGLIRTTLVSTPSDPIEQEELLQPIVNDILATVGATGLTPTVRIDTSSPRRAIIIEVSGAATITSASPGVQVDSQTIRIEVPADNTPLSTRFNAVSFTIRQGTTTRTFGFATGGAAANPGAVPVIGLPSGTGGFGEVAERIRLAIAGSGLDMDTVVVARDPLADPPIPQTRVLIGAPAGTTVSTGSSGLSQDGRTLSVRIPTTGNGAQGVVDGANFTLSNGTITQTFEFQGNAAVNDPAAILIPILGPLTGDEIASRVVTAVANSPLRLQPVQTANVVYFNLPSQGTASAIGGNLRIQGVSRPISDGDILRVSETPQPASPAIEIGVSFPSGQLLTTAAAIQLNGQIITVTNSDGANVRFELFAAATARNPVPGARLLDVTDTILGPAGERIDVVASRETVARRLAAEIRDVQQLPVGGTALGFDAVAQDALVFLDLDNSTAVAGGPRITSPVPSITLNGEARFVERLTFEFDLESTALPTGDGVLPDSIRVPFRATDSANALALRISDLLNANSGAIDGLGAGSFADLPGQVQLDADNRVTVDLSPGSSLEVRGEPGVTGGSIVEVFGPLVLQLPALGGVSINDGSVLTLRDDAGVPQVFQFQTPQATFTPLVGAILVPFVPSQTSDLIAISLATAINGANIDIVATAGGFNVSLGRIDQGRASTADVGTFTGATAISIVRSIVGDGELFVLRQGAEVVTYEFVDIAANRDALPGRVQVSFQQNDTPGEVAEALAAAIRNSPGALRFSLDETGTPLQPVALTDASGAFNGQIELNVVAGTQVDVSAAPTLLVTGVPGGAQPIPILPSQGSEEIRLAILKAIEDLQDAAGGTTTTLVGEDRGGNTIFLENASLIQGPIVSYFLPAIKDVAGNNLESNRPDQSTQFTLLMPEIGLDYGDAPDPVTTVPGRYPTSRANDGARHIVTPSGPFLGRFTDAEADGRGVSTADGDDLSVSISTTGTLFGVSVTGGVATILVNPSDLFNETLRDGDTITINTGEAIATLEFDVDGIFDEDRFAIRPADVNDDGVLDSDEITRETLATAIVEAINQSPLRPAGVQVVSSAASTSVLVIGDDEDGVTFPSSAVFNKGIITPIDVEVSGIGVLQAWIDFNADGDWTDPGENVIDNVTFDTTNPDGSMGRQTLRFNVTIPATSPNPIGGAVTDSYARFRVSRNGGLEPSGLALSGEVEDYRVTLLPGRPPTVSQTSRTYTVPEGSTLQVSDQSGVLQGVSDPDGQAVAVADPSSVVVSPAGAGTLTLRDDGSFTFNALGDFNGPVTFEVRVRDVVAGNPSQQLTATQPVFVTINVTPVNDAPVLRPGVNASDVIARRTINEDNVISQANQTVGTPVTLDAEDLIDPFYLAGPGNEPAQQRLFFSSVGSSLGENRTSRGGTVSISTDGRRITYVPPVDVSGGAPDTFTYTVGDDRLPGEAIFASLNAAELGRVEVTLTPINDQPRLNNNSYNTSQGVELRIPLRGVGGVLTNDTAGPANEVDPPVSQSIDLKPNQFQRIVNGQVVLNLPTLGGTIELAANGTELIYRPRATFAGLDQFPYTVVDSEGAEATARVFISVGNINDEPEFVGVSGVPGVVTLESQERKVVGDVETFDLNVWFRDPDGDVLTFGQPQIVSGAATVVPTVVGNQLRLEYNRFGSGVTVLRLTATDPSQLLATQDVTLTVVGTPDPPQVTGSFNPTVILEDASTSLDLASLFFDPDNDPLTYQITRLGSIIDPTATQIANHPLVRSIQVINNRLVIQPQPDQFGSVNIEISAFDGTFSNSHNFTLQVLSVEDAPRGGADGYNVPIGGTLRVSDPLLGLLRNDSDPDAGNTISVAPGSLTQPTYGTVSLGGAVDGTFTYMFDLSSLPDGDPIKTDPRLLLGQTDTFTYRTIDSTNRQSAQVTVTVTFNESPYQNPFNRFDVTADGRVTAIDALRVINFLGRAAGDVLVSSIGTPPPDFLDVSGDGRVSALDALQVINELNRRSVGGVLASSVTSGEPIVVGGFDTSATTRFSSTTTHASLATANLGGVNAVPPTASARDETTAASPLDALLGSGLEINVAGGAIERATESLVGSAAAASSSEATSPIGSDVDDVLTSMLDDDLLGLVWGD